VWIRRPASPSHIDDSPRALDNSCVSPTSPHHCDSRGRDPRSIDNCAQDGAPHVFTLIHGTRSPQAAWTAESSILCNALRARFGNATRFHQFVWSGKNSVFARQQAAAVLEDELGTSIAELPAARHYLIGHSHGGNIALKALGRRHLANAVAGVACLSTPFIHIRRRPFANVFFVIVLLGVALQGASY
jgi:hypothetical protein